LEVGGSLLAMAGFGKSVVVRKVENALYHDQLHSVVVMLMEYEALV